MKKKRFIGVAAGAGVFILVLVFVICFTSPTANLFESGNKRYALNLYDPDMQYTRGIEAFYNKNGTLKSLEVYIIYDNNAPGISAGGDSQTKYPDAVSACVINDDGSVRISNYLTAKSIEAGALEDKDFFMAASIYDTVKTEDGMKSFLENQLQRAKENGIIPADGINYIIINNKNTTW